MPKKEWIGTNFLAITWRIVSTGISILLWIFFLLILISFVGFFITPESIEIGNVAVIPITGLITTDGEDQTFTSSVSSKDIVDLIKKADEKKEIKAILFEINSPGGHPVATDEIASAIKNTNKTTIAVIRETGASGAYWIATAADRIFANRMSVTGSIGVKASSLEFAGLLTDYNVTYRRLVAGKYKDTGTPFRTMMPEEQALYQNVLDKLHSEFIKAVAENRGLPEEYVRPLATGFIYLGSEAKELKLIDEFGGKEEALKYLENTLGITAKTVTYKSEKTIFEKLSKLTAENFFYVGQGIGSVFTTETEISFT
ncbi:MAG TPA: signal peptide peptidase SppA [Candidatus Nanoarchaeia archaeon]|nr:signal peptide peptidase SppA [Candidatus Nanoarchaeia archaeon]